MRYRRENAVLANDTLVPFVDISDSTRSFGDIGDESAIDDPLAMTAGWRSFRNNLEVGPNFEVVIGEDRSLPSAFLAALAEYRRCVCKIVVRGTNYRGRSGTWSGTGFLVGKNLLLTNHHVLNSIETAESAIVDFEFEQPMKDFLGGLVEPQKETGSAGKRFKLDPRRLFVTSPATNGGLDYTFVWIGDEAQLTFGHIPLVRAAFGAYENEQAFVLHHPSGRARRVSLDDTDILKIYATVLRYTSDTMPGSSGSPVFNRQCRLIALHHASQEDSIAGRDGRKYSVLNEGIKIAAIAIDLERRRTEPEGQKIGAILAEIQGSDTMSGYFGALGRSRHNESADISGLTAVEAVVDTYRGTDSDTDIGFWNIEWLSNRYTEPDKLRMAAALVVDLGLDIWGLSEVSPNAVRALVQELKHQFKEDYAYELSEPDATDGKQSTAVIWKQKTVEGKRVSWPDDIERLWHLDSRDPLEAIDGKIFNRYPGLFRFKAKGKSGVSFHLVPLHLKAMEEGSKRRRLASKLLARAVKAMSERPDFAGDWVIGGDFNAELANNDFDDLLSSGFAAMSAEDERQGAMSYLKSPNSLIDHIFLSPNLAKQVGQDGFFIVAKEKSVDAYVNKLSDHRPVLIRLAHNKNIAAQKPADDEDALDALADRLVGDGGRSKRRRMARPAEPARRKIGAAARVRGLEADDYDLVSQGLTKRQFLEQNATELARMRVSINARLRGDYGNVAATVSLKDFAVMLNCEGGLKGGKVDPEHEHSEGERGLFPLPSNIAFWNGADAPDTEQLMPLDVNCYHFMLYLGQLKNRSAPGMPLYKGHFLHGGIKGDIQREARLLAGIVHGYFVRANYGGGAIPKAAILDGYATDVPLPELMAGTGYVHAGKPLMIGRHDNIEAALHWSTLEASSEGAFGTGFEIDRLPWQYMAFASDWSRLAEELNVDVALQDGPDDVALAVVKRVRADNPGKRILFGFDASDVDGGVFPKALRAVRNTPDAGLMIYAEGPGGPTDGTWLADEKARIKTAAGKEGVDVTQPEHIWFKQWVMGPWWSYTSKQLQRFKEQGFEAAEVDNLYQAVGESDAAVALLAFLDTYRRGFEADRLPRLVLKNLTGPQLRKVAAAVDSGRLTRDLFADFHIAENDTGVPAEQTREAAKLAIRTIFSTDTNAYTASGPYGLEDAFNT